MSVSTLHVLHGILNGSTFISQLNDTTPANNHEELIGMAAGHPYPLFTGIRGAKPDVQFTSPQIKTILDATGVTGVDWSGGNTDLWLKKAADLGVRTPNATTDHLRLRIAQAYLFWSSIRAQHQQDAEINGRLLIGYDGTNLPIVAAGSLAISGTPTAAEFYTLGGVKVNGSFIGGVEEWTLDLGAQPFEESSDGEPYNTFIGMKEFSPMVLTVRTKHATAWTSYGLTGLAVTALVFFLRKKANEGTNVADATAEHISFTVTDGLVLLPQSSGRGNEMVSNELRILIRPSASESAGVPIVPIVISTAAAIA